MSDQQASDDGAGTEVEDPTSPTARGPLRPPAPSARLLAGRCRLRASATATKPTRGRRGLAVELDVSSNAHRRAGRVDGRRSADRRPTSRTTDGASRPAHRRHRPGHGAAGRGVVAGARRLRGRVLAAPRGDRAVVQPACSSELKQAGARVDEPARAAIRSAPCRRRAARAGRRASPSSARCCDPATRGTARCCDRRWSRSRLSQVIASTARS